jgi:hypothetical protein
MSIKVSPRRNKGSHQTDKQSLFFTKPKMSSDRVANEPRVVTVGFSVNAIKKVDAIEGTVEVDFILYVQWIDPSLVGVAVEDRPPYTEGLREEQHGDQPCLWNPNLEINNDVSLEQMWEKFPAPYQDAASGKVVWGARYRGAISNRMNLRQFPMDSDYIAIVVGSKDMDESKMLLEVDPDKHGFKDAPGDRIKDNQLEEWSLDVPIVSLKRSGPTGSGAYYANIEYGLVVHRLSWFYSSKILSIVYMLVFVSWTVFFIPPVNFVDRLNIILVLFLSTIAFLYVANDSLPKVPYLTLLDKLMLTSFVSQFVVLIESFIAFILAKQEEADAAMASGNSGSGADDARSPMCTSWFTQRSGCTLLPADALDLACFMLCPLLFVASQGLFVQYAMRERRRSRRASLQQATVSRLSKASAAAVRAQHQTKEYKV